MIKKMAVLLLVIMAFKYRYRLMNILSATEMLREEFSFGEHSFYPNGTR